ncbi:MAG: hypothetical protein J5875_03755 [Paludibacteraceae bacterium]|nr:hypothetical protein [Paludibacteraceae bacterium]
MSSNYRIAVASKKGVKVDVHFGLADHFHVFEFSSEGECKYLGPRQTTAACLASCCSGGNEEKAFCSVVGKLADVQAIFVSKIGEGAANYIEGHGKHVYETTAPIEPLIHNIIQTRLYETDKWQPHTNN